MDALFTPTSTLHSIMLLVVVCVITMISRLLPFFIFTKTLPKSFITLSKILPPAMISMLLVYCFSITDVRHPPFGLNELCALVITASIYMLTKIGVLAVILGTLSYATLVQTHIIEKLFSF